MIDIPVDTYEMYLTRWFEVRMGKPFDSEEDKVACALLYRLSKSEMREIDRGSDNPFIGSLHLTSDEVSLLLPYMVSENVQVRAYCNDVCHKSQEYPKKFEMATSASTDYLSLYLLLHHSSYLLRSVTVRSYKPLHDLSFVERICRAVSEVIYPLWMKDICAALRKSYSTEELKSLSTIIIDKIAHFKGSHRDEERAYFASLKEIGVFSSDELYHQTAISFEKEYDQNISNKKPSTIYPNNVSIIQNAYTAICLVKKDYSADERRIREKLINEQKDFNENLIRFGPKIRYSIPKERIKYLNELIDKANIHSPIEALRFITSIPFPLKSQIDEACVQYAKRNPMSAYFGGSRTGDQGQTIGKTGPDQFQRIEVYMCTRLDYRYLIGMVLNKSIENWEQFSEEDIGQAIYANCKSTVIEKDRIPIWAKGFVSGLKGDYIVSTHLLIPQIERYMVRKAEAIHGDLLALDNPDHQDEAGLSKALNLLKPIFKEDLFNDFWYFLNDASDVNLRNKVAHGLISSEEMISHAPYCLLLAAKLYFCETEIFTE